MRLDTKLTDVEFLQHLSKTRICVYGVAMSLRLTCPCGTAITGETEDELVVLAQEHLGAEHQGREYTREEILFLAM